MSGTGPAGVVTVHQSDGDHWGWAPVANNSLGQMAPPFAFEG